MELEASGHSVATTPNTLPDPIAVTMAVVGDADWLCALADADTVYQWDNYVSSSAPSTGEPLGGGAPHGHPDPLTCPEGESRRSLAFYYYSAVAPDNRLYDRAYWLHGDKLF